MCVCVSTIGGGQFGNVFAEQPNMFLQSNFNTGILMASVLARAVRHCFDDVYRTLSVTLSLTYFGGPGKGQNTAVYFSVSVSN